MKSTTLDGTIGPQDLKDIVVARAHALGFESVRITEPGALGEAGWRLDTFLEAGRHGDMDWLKDTAARRRDPRMLMASARSVVVVGLSYAPDSDPMLAIENKDRGVISVYAQGRDYHEIIKGRLKEIAGLMATRSGLDVKVFVDTAPLMEKPLAHAAGVGWQGKHTNLVSREHGSWLFLGAILCEAELPVDAPSLDHCGTCRRCLDVCPTNAFPAPYQLDARRCIAYLTNEYGGHIAREFREPIGNRIFGCDDCLAVCPWNKYAGAARETRFRAKAEADNPPLSELLELDDRAFRLRFSGTPVKRLGRDRFIRNVLIAAGNSGDASLLSKVVVHLDDGSPLVRAMAVWAARQLLDVSGVRALKDRYQANEDDRYVCGEWNYEEA